jgi:hypothetical protein
MAAAAMTRSFLHRPVKVRYNCEGSPVWGRGLTWPGRQDYSNGYWFPSYALLLDHSAAHAVLLSLISMSAAIHQEAHST